MLTAEKQPPFLIRTLLVEHSRCARNDARRRGVSRARGFRRREARPRDMRSFPEAKGRRGDGEACRESPLPLLRTSVVCLEHPCATAVAFALRIVSYSRGHSLIRLQQRCSQRQCSRGSATVANTCRLPSAWSGQRWSRLPKPTSPATRSTVRSWPMA